MTDFTIPTVTFNDDREMPLIGLGTYKLRDEEGERAVREAIELGYRKFDTATLYKNEEVVGKALRDAIAAGDVTRDEIFVTTKLWHDHHGADKAPVAFQESLDKLGLDYIDLYLIHWPWPQGDKYVETFEAIARLQGMGQIASIGVANFYEEALQRIIDEVGITPVLNQVELHPGFTQPELRAYHESHGIITEAWSPLARGVVLNNPDIKGVAAAVGATPGQVVLRYLMQLGISVIPKSAHRERLEENLGAVGIELTRDQMDIVGALDGQEGFGRMFADPREFPGAEG
ncbi:aldo/keto reductase [uncultured Corynebacterium sp.]|uniref:aldo/keto reductase n=1 Tax=uncultured Corynebacterium sp. TaxID=159447 RepID=UPI0025D78772|nr:aldo/keto reductase [uncultured Corynebacterium sp.]